jgi:ribosomal protein S17E
MVDKTMPAGRQDQDPTEAVKEALTLAIKNLDEKFAAKFAANDQAVTIARDELRAQLLAFKTTIDGQFSANKELVDQLAKANKDLVDQLSKANSVALQAALSTQKESAAKSELAIGELLKQLQLNYETANKAIIETLNRLTSRLDTGDGRVFATGENKSERTTDKGQILILASVIIAAAAFVVALYRGH